MIEFISNNWLVISLIFGCLYVIFTLIEKRSGK